ncbi:MAG: hypothetical protein QOI60_332 [Actinomycetota bacterium]|jgi:hypothetical protein|nr:hypothetical protein [Actinomycetota bacterium]MEA2580129.1 hypothetical protein [Actinomycetota bacterium]
MSVDVHRPKTLTRRVERAIVGFTMAIVALILERVVMKTVRKEGGTMKDAPGKVVTSKGGEVDA